MGVSTAAAVRRRRHALEGRPGSRPAPRRATSAGSPTATRASPARSPSSTPAAARSRTWPTPSRSATRRWRMLLTDVKGAPGAAQALAPALTVASPARRRRPAQRIQAVQQDQDRLIDAAETFAKNRADRLKPGLPPRRPRPGRLRRRRRRPRRPADRGQGPPRAGRRARRRRRLRRPPRSTPPPTSRTCSRWPRRRRRSRWPSRRSDARETSGFGVRVRSLHRRRRPTTPARTSPAPMAARSM